MPQQTTESYRELTRSILDSDTVASVRASSSVGSAWGEKERPFREKAGGSLTVQPGEYLMTSSSRPLNIEYAYTSSLWILLGRDDFTSLRQFNPYGEAFTSDGDILCAAFGARIRAQGRDQLTLSIDLLRRDPTTRRAMILIGRPDDIHSGIKDYPCATSLQFLWRSDGLHLVVHMRSQSLMNVFPYDLVNFAYIQQYAASRLNVPIGPMHWLFGSVHIYEDEAERASQLAEESELNFQPLPILPRTDHDIARLYARWCDPEQRQETYAAYHALKP